MRIQVAARRTYAHIARRSAPYPYPPRSSCSWLHEFNSVEVGKEGYFAPWRVGTKYGVGYSQRRASGCGEWTVPPGYALDASPRREAAVCGSVSADNVRARSPCDGHRNAGFPIGSWPLVSWDSGASETWPLWSSLSRPGFFLEGVEM